MPRKKPPTRNHAPLRPGQLTLNEDGKWVLNVEDGRAGTRSATKTEADARIGRLLERTAAQVREFWAAATENEGFRPNPDSRYLDYVAWAKGVSPGYRPTWADRVMLAAEHARVAYKAGESPRKASKRTTNSPDARQASVLKWIAANPGSKATTIMETQGRKDRSAFDRDYLKPLRDAVCIESKTGDQGHGYYVTEQGLAFLASPNATPKKK